MSSCWGTGGCAGEKAIWKGKMETKMVKSYYFAVTDYF